MSDGPITISRQEAWRIFELMEQMNDFLHQPENYRSREDVEAWLNAGVYDELSDLFYRVVADWFPVDEGSGRVLPPAGVRRKFKE